MLKDCVLNYKFKRVYYNLYWIGCVLQPVEHRKILQRVKSLFALSAVPFNGTCKHRVSYNLKYILGWFYNLLGIGGFYNPLEQQEDLTTC